MALPVYVGKMIYVGHWAASASQSGGSGRLDLDPEFLLGVDDLRHDPRVGGRVVFRDIARNNDQRTFVSALIPGLFPCGNVLPVLEPSSNHASTKIELAAYLSSFAFDWSARQRMSGTHLNWHVAESLALPPPESSSRKLFPRYASVILAGIQFAGDWLQLSRVVPQPNLSAFPLREQLRIVAMVDSVGAAVMGLSMPDLRHAYTNAIKTMAIPHPATPRVFGASIESNTQNFAKRS